MVHDRETAMKRKNIALNMVANIISFFVSLCISFFLTPYVIEAVGMETYGLVGLANSFVGYLTVVTAALNSMASRFIVIELHREHEEKARTYFSSVLIANTVLAVLITIPALWLILNIGVLNVSDSLLTDARITFALILFNFIVSLLSALYGIVLYARNILWKGSFRTVEGNVIRVVLIGLFFTVFSRKVYYVVLATFLSGLYCIAFNVYYTRKYTPELRVEPRLFSLQAIRELVSAGIWNSVTRLSQILLDGLDLLLSNLFIDGVMTGNVSVAKTIPALYTGVLGVLSDSFYPSFLELYSKRRMAELIEEIKLSISVLSGISGICMSMLFVYAREFYSLWLPDSDAGLLQVLTYLATGTVMISGCVYSLFSVFSLTNKVRNNSIALLITGLLSVATTFVCLKFTDLGIYAIVGVSSVYGIIRNMTFTPIYAAKCLGLPSGTFYPVLFRNLLTIAVLVLLDMLVKHLLYPASWLLLIANGAIDVLIGVVVTVFISFGRKERKAMLLRAKAVLARMGERK